MIAAGSPRMGVDDASHLHVDQQHRPARAQRVLGQPSVMKRLVPLIAALALVCAAAFGCAHPRKEGHLKVADEKKLSEGLDAFFHKVIDVLDAGRPATAPTGGPAPCDQFDVMDFKDGESSPYNIASFSSIDGITPDKAVPAIMRLKAFAEHSGWKISSFRPATDGRTITELAGHAANYRYGYGYGFRVEALHDANRIVMSVGSDCVRDPRDHRH